MPNIDKDITRTAEPFSLRKAREELLDRFAEVNLLDVMPLIEKQDEEFVRRLKEELKVHEKVNDLIIKRIDKLAGMTESKSFQHQGGEKWK